MPIKTYSWGRREDEEFFFSRKGKRGIGEDNDLEGFFSEEPADEPEEIEDEAEPDNVGDDDWSDGNKSTKKIKDNQKDCEGPDGEGSKERKPRRSNNRR